MKCGLPECKNEATCKIDDIIIVDHPTMTGQLPADRIKVVGNRCRMHELVQQHYHLSADEAAKMVVARKDA